MSSSGRVALITGAARGLGLEMAKALARAGATVILNGRDKAALQQALRSLEDLPGANRPDMALFDITDDAERTQALSRIQQHHGGLDILINNVGMRDRRPLDAFAIDDIRHLMDVNLIAPLALAPPASTSSSPTMSAKARRRSRTSTSPMASRPGRARKPTISSGATSPWSPHRA